AVPSVERVVAYCRTEAGLRAFCKKVGAEAGESNQAAAEQDIVVTVTSSKDPVLRGEWLPGAVLVCAVGANHPRRRARDTIARERCRSEGCELLGAGRGSGPAPAASAGSAGSVGAGSRPASGRARARGSRTQRRAPPGFRARTGRRAAA